MTGPTTAAGRNTVGDLKNATRRGTLRSTLRLGLRLTVAGGRESATRLTVLAAAVTLGVALLLTTLAGLNAFFTQGDRYSWLNSGGSQARAQAATAPTHSPLWWHLDDDLYGGKEIARVDVAPTGPDSPVPPGLTRLPGPGEYVASPALATLLRSVPADQLADRYPGRLAGTIGDAGLPSPDSLYVVVGRDAGQMAHMPGATRITHIVGAAGDACRDCGVGTKTAAIDLVVSAVAAGLLFPLLILIGTATRLNAARREERFAAMRLVGATPGQISVLATVETAVAAALGSLVGLVLFALLRDRLAAWVPFTGERFFPEDMRPGIGETLAVTAGVPLVAALAARITLRRVRVSPLGVTRRVTPSPPRAYRLIPLVVGIGELTWFVGRRPQTSDGQTAAFLPGFLLVMVGLVVAGPWLTMVGARVLARRSATPAGLIAARRLADNPRAAFRAVSGLVLALFVTAVATGTITTITAHRSSSTVDAASRGTLTDTFWDNFRNPGLRVEVGPTVSELETIAGVRGVTIIRANPDWRPEPTLREVSPGATNRLPPPPRPPGLLSCVDLARMPAYGRCPAGAEVAEVEPGLVRQPTDTRTADPWPAATIPTGRLATLPVLSIVVRTNGSAPAVERARTVLELAFPAGGSPSLDHEFNNAFADTLSGWRQLANVMIVASLVIGAVGLAVVVVGGMTERKRPFSLLRLSGVPLRALRRVVLLESAVPLIVAALVSTGTGFLAADLFLRAQMQYPLRPPGAGFYLVTVAGLLAALAVIAGTLPLLRRITGPETARNG